MSLTEFEINQLAEEKNTAGIDIAKASYQSGLSEEQIKSAMDSDGKLNPDTIEKLMIEEEAKRQKAAQPDEVAAMLIKLYTSKFNNLIDQLSSRQLRRVMKSLNSYPVEKDYIHNNPIEKEAVAIGRNIQDAKMVLIFDTYKDSFEQLYDAANSPIETIYENPEQNNTNNNEVNENGK